MPAGRSQTNSFRIGVKESISWPASTAVTPWTRSAGNEEGVTRHQTLRAPVDGDVEDAALDVRGLAMRVLMRLADGAGLEDHPNHHQILAIGP